MSTTLSPPDVRRKSRTRPVQGGSKLLCVNDKGLRRKYQPGPPKQGHLYSVREVYTDSGKRGVLLVGIRGPIGAGRLEQGFLLSRFRLIRS